MALAESIVARRRNYAALTATGVPRRTLFATLLMQTFAPLLPALLLSIGAGIAMTRSFTADVQIGGGEPYETCVDPRGDWTICAKHVVVDPLVVMPIPVPVRDLFLLGAGAALAMLVVVGLGMLILRSSTDLEELRAA